MKSALAVHSRLLALGLAAAIGLAPGLAARSASDDARPAIDRAGPASKDRQRPAPTARQATARPTGDVTVTGLGDLPAGKTLTIVFRTSVDAGPFAAGKNSLANQGTVTGSNIPATLTDDPDLPGATDPTVTPLDAAPDLALTKSDGGASVAPGGTVAYTLGYANAGNQGATGVVLNETVPAHTAFNAGASTAGWICSPDNNAGSACTLAVGAVNAAGGGSATFAVTVVSPVPAGVTLVSNTASVADDNANGADPTPANNSASDTTPVDAAPDLTLTKSDGGASVAPGATVAYTLGYANAGNQAATGVVLTETVPAHTTFNAGASTAGWACTPDNNAGSACTLAVGALTGGGASGSATYAVTVVNPVPAGVPQVSNTASLADDGSNGADPTPGNNSASDTTPIDAAPDLTLTKSDGGATAAPGGTVAYTLGYANAGNQGATGVALSETVPAHTTFNPGASTAGWACTPNNNAGSACTLPVGAVNAGGGASATFAVTVVSPVPAGVTQVSNTAGVADDNANGADPTPSNNSASDTTPIDAAPDLTLTKSDGGATVGAGGTVAYALGYANAGNQGATGVVLSETVPAHTTFNPGASTAGWACTPDNNAGSACTLSVGPLNGGGASGSATYAVTVDNPVPAGVTQVNNTASVADDGANGADPTPGNNSASDTTPITATPDLTLTKSDGGTTTTPGGTVAYTLGYANVGTRGATGVFLTETVPASTTFNPGASTAGWTCVPDNNPGSVCTLNVGGLAATASGNATFAVSVANPVPAGLAQVNNTASVADDGSNGTDPTPANNTASDGTPVTATPDLALVKSDGGATTTAGGTVAYSLSYANAGNQGATGVVLSETVPANTTFNPGASTPGWVCTPDNNAGSACSLGVGGLSGGGASGSAAFAVTVDNPLPAGVTQVSNTASVADDGANGPDPTPADNSSSDSTPVTAAPDLRLVLSDQRTLALPGQTLAYQLTLDNVGTQAATGVVLTAGVPASSTFDPAASTAGWSCAGSSCSLNVAGAVVAGAPAQSFVLAVRLAAVILPGTIVSNSASAADDGSNGPDPNTANNSSTDSDTLVTAKGDFDSDGAANADLAFQNQISGKVVVWFMNGPIRAGGTFMTPPDSGDPLWKARATDDLDGNGRVDLVWRHAGNGNNQVWFLNGTVQVASVPTNPAAVTALNWQIVGSGQFNLAADNQADLLWQNDSSGKTVVWLMNGATRLAGVFTNPDQAGATNWKAVGTGDFNVDGQSDILWRNVTSGSLVVWLMNGTDRTTGQFVSPGEPDLNWQVAAVADYDNDGDPDVLWWNSSTGKMRLWTMNGLSRLSSTALVPDQVGAPAADLGWRPFGPR